ncbi:YcxB family protein [Kineothrix sp. MSJ-39]|nr:YcxB family protein [Kineothrix sp. MSJ-39]
MLYEVDVHMNTSVLYDYMLRHTYTSPGGLIATIIGVFAIIFAMKNAGVLYLIAGIVIILYLPWNLYLSAKRQALTNEAFKKPLHYIFTKEGIYVSQGDQVEMQRWENMHQAVATGKSIIIYTSKVNASIFPRADLAENTVTVIELICRYMDPKKVKIRQ